MLQMGTSLRFMLLGMTCKADFEALRTAIMEFVERHLVEALPTCLR